MNSFEEARRRAIEEMGEEGQDPTTASGPPPLIGEAGQSEESNETPPSPAEPPPSGGEDFGQSGTPVPTESANASGEMSEQDRITEEAVATAEQAAMQVQQLQSQLMQMQSQMQQMAGQNQTLQDTIRQMSEQHEAQVIEQAMQNQAPSLDFSSLAFDDDETAASRQREYAEALTEYIRGNVLKELDPLISESREGKAAKEFEAAIADMENTPELAGAAQLRPQLEQILQNNKVIAGSDASMEDKLIMAYTIARGVDAIQHPPTEPTADELFSKYQSNEDFRRLVEQDRLKKVNEQPKIPPFSAGGGAGNAALNIPEKPKTLAEAKRMAMGG